MKKKLFLVVSIVLCCMFVLSSCKGSSSRFGEFGYNGIYLTSFATKSITSVKAKEILKKNSNKSASTAKAMSLVVSGSAPSLDQGVIDDILSKYSVCTIKTKFYLEGETNQSSKVDTLMGTDLKAMLEDNQFAPFSQLVAKYIIGFPELIDTMETVNEEFKASKDALTAPFTDVFTYHTNSSGDLVVHTRDYTEIPSSIGGGIGASYRQDTELLYDKENKIKRWQTSLGLYSATPHGTMKQGYILEVEFEWSEKK